MSNYLLLDFLHILLFVYWLGPDWGVFVNGRRVADPTLSNGERMRFLKASVAIDFFPRSCVVLIVAVGLTLASVGHHIPLGPVGLTLTWAVAVIWLLLVWFTGYVLQPGPLKARLDGIHVNLRHVVTVALAGVGIYSLVSGAPIASQGLAVKFLLVAVLIAIGSVLRVIVKTWVADLTGVPGSEGAIARTYPHTRKLVYFFWLLSISIAFLGVTKPF